MRSVETSDTKINVIKCPNCGRKQISLINYTCSSCDYQFDEEECKEDNWIEETVEGVECDECGEIVACVPENVSGLGLMCPNPDCREEGRQRLLSIRYRGKWRPPEAFLRLKDRYGILQATTKREKIAAKVLNYKAKKETKSFLSVPSRGVFVKVLWTEGEARGYYSFSPSWGESRIPCLTQEFVLPEHRRRGYGKWMVEDFLRSFEEDVALEGPLTGPMGFLLKVMGLVKEQGEKLVSINERIGFVR